MKVSRPVTTTLLGAALVLGLALTASSAATPPATASAGNGNASNARSALEAVYDYGVCRGTNDRCYNDWGNRADPAREGRVLLYTRTVGPRHAHLGPALPAGLNPELGPGNVAQANLVKWLDEAGIAADWTEDVAQLSSAGRLRPYHTVIFLSTTRDTLDDNAQTALMQYIRGGGGFVGIHNAFGTEYHWKWYEGLLGGTNFYDHGRHQTATVHTESKRDPSTSGLPRTWEFKDEWYNLYPEPSHVQPLLRVDEATMAEGTTGSLGHPGHGKDHLVSWCHYYDGGRAWLTTLGHDVAAWTDAELVGDTHFRQHVMGGIRSTMGITAFCQK
ncbi:ThuA domain-containing protein [Polymorphospora rubra]|uniref:Glycosyl hydrolase n=1 Tax=Polymorphospora rubra TaxID=338584 RepID=A0A810N404_9ACTN|nr:ThuA domain-containing protein [Polymorphospora rubra]BCJ68441.1 glycosyl hydrolase [Polymorphospora rubra]